MTRKSDSSRKVFHELERLSYQDSADFIYRNISGALLFTNLNEFWGFAFKQINHSGMILEFGVYSGTSINYFSERLSEQKDGRLIYGFDSFKGLSEPWGGTALNRGYFNKNGEFPKVNSNVELIIGWISDTLPVFVESKNLTENKISFMHLDVDTYTPTKFILETVEKYFLNGTIIIFDELLGYPGWRKHEFKALVEALDSKWIYEYIAFCEIHRKDFTSDHIRAAIRIVKKK